MNIRINPVLVQYFSPFMGNLRRKYPALRRRHELWYAFIRELERVHYARLESTASGKFVWVETPEFMENIGRFMRRDLLSMRPKVFRVHSSRLLAVESLVAGQHWFKPNERTPEAYVFGREIGTLRGTLS